MRKLLRNFTLPALLLLSIVGNAHADLDYNTAYMVTNNNSTILSNPDINSEYNYHGTPTPWVYLKLNSKELNTNAPLKVLWSWSNYQDPSVNDSNIQQFSILNLSGDKEIWSAPTQAWWESTGGHGKWTVDLAWLNAQGATKTSTATFNVTPEPVSGALFLFGGVPLAAALLRKRKQII